MRAMAPLVAVTAASLFLAPLARAQTAPDDDPYPAPPAEEGPPPTVVPAPAPPVPGSPPPVVAPSPSPREFEQMLRYDPEYRAAKGRRLAGILVSSIGGGAGLALAALFGLASLAVCSGTSDAPCSELGRVALGSLIVGGVSLGIGLPLVISGQSRMNEVRARRSREPGVSVFPRGAALGGTWRF